MRRLIVLTGAVLLATLASPAFGSFDDGELEIEFGENPFVYEGGEVDPGVSVSGSGLTLESEEVKYLAERHGVESKEALEIANWMMAAELAVMDVRRAHPDSFAGSEFIHDSGSIHLDIWVTGDGEAEISTLTAELPKAGPGTVGVKTAPMSEAALLSLAESGQLRSGGSEYGALDFRTGTYVAADPEIATTFELDDACTGGTGGWLEGGRLLRLATSTESHYDKSDGCRPATSFCTAGFTARLNGKQGILTAGHCIDDFPLGHRNVTEMYANGEELFVSLRSYLWDGPADDDAGFVNEVYGSAEPRGRIYLTPTHGWRNITHLLPDAPPDGATRCIKSAAPDDLGTPPNHHNGYKCGSVSEGNFCRWSWGIPWCRYTEVTNSSWNDFPEGGSSGGPWFYGGAAAGVHSFSGTDTAVYYRLEHAKNLFPTLGIYCGGTNEFICAWP